MKDRIKHNALLLAIVTVIVGLDQWTKRLVSHKLALGESVSPIAALGDFFRITHWHNTGAAFGLFQNANLILLITSLVIAIAVLFYYQGVKKTEWLTRVALSMIVAGAAGNIIDRIKFGYVIDFLAFGKFPVFNVADSAVTVGVCLMLISYLLAEQKAKKANDEAEPLAEKTSEETLPLVETESPKNEDET